MNRKTLRLLGTLMLALSLLLLLSSAAFAKDTAQLDYEDIALRVPKENKNLDIMQRSLPMLQKARDKMDGGSYTDAGMDELFQIYGQIANAADTTTAAGLAQHAWANMVMGSLTASQQMSAGFASMTGIDLQIEQMRIQIQQTQAQLINTGQMLFGSWHQLQYLIEALHIGRELLEESLQLAKVQQTAGIGTALAVKEAELALFDYDTGIKQLESQCAQLLSQLKLIVGWPQIQIIKLGSIPRPNRQFLDKIDLVADTKSACDNSYSIKLKQAEQKYTDGDDQKNIIKLTIEAQKEQIALSLSTQYYKIVEANNTLLLEEQRLVVLEEKIKQARLQHQLGLLADIALQTEENFYTGKHMDITHALDALFWEIESYKAIVAGLN